MAVGMGAFRSKPTGGTVMCYEKFRNLDFGIVPEGEWPRLMWDLFEFEDMLLLTS